MDIYIYIVLLVATAGIALFRWRILSSADKWIAALLTATLVQESVAGYWKSISHNNYITYHIYTPIELLLISMYFIRSNGFRQTKYLPYIIGAISIVFSLINTWLFQPYYKINSYFLLFEGCVVISFCLLSFYRLLIRDDVVPRKMTHFWLTICFLFYWSLTYANFGLYGATGAQNSLISQIFNWTLYGANLMFYVGIALVFIRYKKLIPSGE